MEAGSGRRQAPLLVLAARRDERGSEGTVDEAQSVNEG